MHANILTLALALAATALSIVGAAAQTYPSRPVTMIVPYPPGGPTDTLARIFAERLRTSLGQPVIIENVGGGAGSIGVARAARAAPDGYTINFGNVASHVFSTVVFKTQYDVLTDLEPVALMTTSPMWLLSGVKLPAKNLKELIAWLKANPDKASSAVVGPGSPAHLCGVYFQNATGTKFQFVPYKGAGPAMQDVMSGQVELTCLEASATRPHVAGRQASRLCASVQDALAGRCRRCRPSTRPACRASICRSGTGCGRRRPRPPP